MTQTSALALVVPPVQDFLAKAAPAAHPLIVSTYDKMTADTSVGKTRAQSKAARKLG